MQYDGGLLPDIILLSQMLLRSGNNPFKCSYEEVLSSLQPIIMIPNQGVNVLIFYPLIGGFSEGLDAFRFFFIQSE